MYKEVGQVSVSFMFTVLLKISSIANNEAAR